MHIARGIVILAMLFSFGLDGWSAEGPAVDRLATSKGDKGRDVAAEDEAEVFAFLNKHHPELVGLLSNLHANLPREYERAIRDLSRVLERLSQLAQRDPQRHELELQAWVVQSHIHLTVAKLAMNDSASLRDELRELLKQQFDLKLETLRHDRQRHAERLRKMDEQIELMATSREDVVAKQLANLTRSSAAMAETLRDKRERMKKKGDSESRPRP